METSGYGERVSKLEIEFEHINEKMSEIQTDLKEIRKRIDMFMDRVSDIERDITICDEKSCKYATKDEIIKIEKSIEFLKTRIDEDKRVLEKYYILLSLIISIVAILVNLKSII